MELCRGVGLLLIEMWFAGLIDEDSLCVIGLPSYIDSLYGVTVLVAMACRGV